MDMEQIKKTRVRKLKKDLRKNVKIKKKYE